MKAKIESHLAGLGYEELSPGIWQRADLRVAIGHSSVTILLLQDLATHRWIPLLTKGIADFAADLPQT